MKVFGGFESFKGKKRRVFIATTSRKKATEITKIPFCEIQEWFLFWGNYREFKIALADPGVMFVEESTNNFRKL